MAFNAAGYNPYNQFQPSYGTYTPYNTAYSSFSQQSSGYTPQYPGYRYTPRPYIAEQPRFLYVSQPTQSQNTNNSWNWVKFARTAGAVTLGGVMAFLLIKNVAKNEIPDAIKKTIKENLQELFGTDAKGIKTNSDGSKINIPELIQEIPGMVNQAQAILQTVEEAGGAPQIKKTLQQVNEASQALDEMGGIAELREVGQQAKDVSRALDEMGGVARLQEVGQQVLAAWDQVKDNWLFKKFTGS